MIKLTILFLFLQAFQNGLGDAASYNETTACPKYIGTSPDGRLYFVENSTRNTWNDASILCQGCGYELAQINTREQVDFLANTLWEDQERMYWVAARESRNRLEFFAWNSTGETLENLYELIMDATGGPDSTPYGICGMFELKYDFFPPNAWMVAKPCFIEQFTMCMIQP